MEARARDDFPPVVIADYGRRNRDAFLSLAMTQRRLAHRLKREALAWEAQGHRANFIACRLECRRLWNSAKFNLNQARQFT